jgi:hypothetical protein
MAVGADGVGPDEDLGPVLPRGPAGADGDGPHEGTAPGPLG